MPGLFLIEIDREGLVIGPVGPEEVIHVNDRLVFTGVVNTIVDLEKIPGLVPAADRHYEVSPANQWGSAFARRSSARARRWWASPFAMRIFGAR